MAIDLQVINSVPGAPVFQTRDANRPPSTSFRRLPVELQVYIWRLTWEPRTIVLQPRRQADGTKRRALPRIRSSAPLPASLQVNRLSRIETLSCYRVLTFEPRESCCPCSASGGRLFFNDALDSLQLCGAGDFGPFSMRPVRRRKVHAAAEAQSIACFIDEHHDFLARAVKNGWSQLRHVVIDGWTIRSWGEGIPSAARLSRRSNRRGLVMGRLIAMLMTLMASPAMSTITFTPVHNPMADPNTYRLARVKGGLRTVSVAAEAAKPAPGPLHRELHQRLESDGALLVTSPHRRHTADTTDKSTWCFFQIFSPARPAAVGPSASSDYFSQLELLQQLHTIPLRNARQVVGPLGWSNEDGPPPWGAVVQSDLAQFFSYLGIVPVYALPRGTWAPCDGICLPDFGF